MELRYKKTAKPLASYYQSFAAKSEMFLNKFFELDDDSALTFGEYKRLLIIAIVLVSTTFYLGSLMV